jgi:hypothetical protein
MLFALASKRVLFACVVAWKATELSAVACMCRMSEIIVRLGIDGIPVFEPGPVFGTGFWSLFWGAGN